MARSVVRWMGMIVRRASIFIVPILGASACTAILGDFSPVAVVISDAGGEAAAVVLPEAGADGAPGSDGGPDATLADGADGSSADAAEGAPADGLGGQGPADQAAPDASMDGPPVDGPPATAADASEAGVSPTLYKLRCAAGNATSGSRIQITTGNALRADAIRVANMADQRVRIVTVDYPQVEAGSFSGAILRSYTYDQNNQTSALTTTSFSTNSGQVLALDRYAGSHPGFVALFQTYDQTKNQNVFAAARLPDDSNAWVGPATLASAPTNLSNLAGALVTIDGPKDEYYVVFSYVAGGQQVFYAGRLNATTLLIPSQVASYPTAGSNQGPFQMVSPGVAFDGSQAHAILSPSGQNGPPPLGAPALLLVPGASNPRVPITPPSNLNYLPYGLASATDTSKANVFFLVADLNQLQGTYRVGQVPASSLPSLDPMKLPGTPATAPDGGTAQLRDLLINGQNTHWETYGGNEQLIALAQPADLTNSFGGVNFAWWDAASGTLRAYEAGQGALLSDVPSVHRADATFATLVGSIAQFWVAYENAQPSGGMNNYPPPASDIWLTRVGCTR